MSEGVAGDIYSGAAGYGRIVSTIGLVVGSLIGLVAGGAGIYFLVTNSKYTKVVNGTVTSSACNQVTVGNNTEWTCNITATYQVAGKTYTLTTTTEGMTQYAKGQEITIQYDPNNPSDAVVKGFSRVFLGALLIGLAVLVVGGSVLRWYLAKHYKFAAAGVGVSNVAGFFKR